MKRFVVSLSLVLAMALMLCGGMASTRAVAQDVTEIDFMTYLTGPDAATYEALVNRFNDEHPNIKVNFLVSTGGAEYLAQLVLAIRSGNAPAALLLHQDEMPRYINNDMLTGWSQADWETAFNLKLDDFVPAAMQYAVVNGMVYGIALSVFQDGLYYNVDHFVAAGLDPDKPPQTWDEFLQYAQTLTKDFDGDGTPDQWGYFCYGGWQYRMLWQWYSLLWEMGGELLTEDQTEVAFNNEIGVTALQYFVDLIHEYKVCPVEASDGEEAFRLGQLSLHTNGPWMINNFASVEGLNWRVAPMPKWEGNGATWGSSHTLAFPKGVSDKAHAAAVEFGAWMADQGVTLALAGAYPSRISVAQSDEFKAIPSYAAYAGFADAGADLRLPPAVDSWAQAESILIEYFQGALAGDISAEQAIQSAADDIQAALEG
jgi:multiple sugar transport system substrate-binding protein